MSKNVANKGWCTGWILVTLAGDREFDSIFIGSLLQETKDFWRVALLLSTLLFYNDIGSTGLHYKLDERRELYKQVEDAITTQGLDKIWEVKKLVDGNHIMSICMY